MSTFALNLTAQCKCTTICRHPACGKRPSDETCSSFAGADTTAIAINSILYHLMRDPASYEKLTAEIDAAVADGTLSMPATYAEAVKLPYLRACINEGMRLHPSVGLTMPRLIPAGGATISGFHFPAGYRVGVNGAVVHYDKDVFGLDADNFNPDRWIEGNTVRMDKTMIQFGAGPRTCIGKNVSACLCVDFRMYANVFSRSR